MCVCISGGDICWAADVVVDGSNIGETTGSEDMYKITGGVHNSNSFKDENFSEIKTKGYSYGTVTLFNRWSDDLSHAYTFGYNEKIYTPDKDDTVSNIANELNVERFYVKTSDGNKVDIDNSWYWSASSPNSIIDIMNEKYWNNIEYAEEIAEALSSGDYSKLENMPLLYGVDADGNEFLISMHGSFSYTEITDKEKNIKYNTAANTYDSVKVSGGLTWRPLDRVTESIRNSPLLKDNDYTINNGFFVDTSGSVSSETNGNFSGGADIEVTQPDKSESEFVGSKTAIKIGALELENNAAIDLTWANVSGDDPLINYNRINVNDTTGQVKYEGYVGDNQYKLARDLYIDNAKFGNNTTLRLGSYKGTITKSDKAEKDGVIESDGLDVVYIKDFDTATGEKVNINIELGYVPGLGMFASGNSVWSPQGTSTDKKDSMILGILNGDNKAEVSGKTSLVDGIFGMYEITPDIQKAEDYFDDPEVDGGKKGSAWYLNSYTYTQTDAESASGKAATDNSILLNNLWKSNYLSMFKRAGKLHRESSEKENLWAEAFGGKFKSSSKYGNKLSQNYSGVQIGYDKLLSPELWGGKVYTGFYLNKIDGSGSFSGTDSDQSSIGVGAYASWTGKKGHYLDFALTGSKLKDEYSLYTTMANGTQGKVDADYGTWAYGLGVAYGKYNKLKDGWFYNPQAAFFAGHVDETDYELSNGLKVRQSGYDTATGKLGIDFGKNFAEGKGNIYIGAAVLHEFAGDRSLRADYYVNSKTLAELKGKDTWGEFKIGGNVKISPTGTVNLDFVKTAGSEVGSEWSINGGANWTWGGFYGSGKKADVKAAAVQEYGNNGDGGLEAGNAGEVKSVRNVEVYRKANQPTVVVGEPGEESVYHENGDEQTMYVSDGDVAGGLSEGYVMPGVTVEAKRPDWEKKLSPGQVTVIHTKQFEGEQKDLPTLLERVPGLFVQRVSGTGHYTVARSRGSTAAQVNVYVDGVLMNLNGDAAVNLATIPIDNVERVEVYRGYVPARFSGSPLGGVINIVTKKPDKVGGSISQGIRSYGGYTGNYELTTPLGSGSLMATFQRDIWTGDFDFQARPENITDSRFDGVLKRRSNGYQNNNGMLKWQDERWMVKAQWKDTWEQLPYRVDQLKGKYDTSWYEGSQKWYDAGYYDKEQRIKQKEFLVGLQDTSGNLDYGIKAYYVNSTKDYVWVGAYKAQEDHNNGVINWQPARKPGSWWTSYESNKYGVNLNSAYKMGSRHLLEANFDYSDETMDANGNEWDQWNSGSGKDYGRTYLTRYKIKEYHFTLQDTITLNQDGDFKMTPIVRADKVDMETMGDNDKKWQWSAGVGLQKSLNDHWSFKTTWGTYNRHPNFYELFGDGATIMPNEGSSAIFGAAGTGAWERGTQFDFGLNWQGYMAKADTDTILTWFQRRTKNQYALWYPIAPNAPASYMALDDAWIHGIELSHNMKWDRLSLNISATWQKSEYSGVNNKIGNQPIGIKPTISYTPEWLANVRLDYLFPGDKLNLFAEYNYIGKQFTGMGDMTASQSVYLQPLKTIDIGAKFKFNNNWRLTAGVNDLFNSGYDVLEESSKTGMTHTSMYPYAGRMYYTTLEYRF